MMCCTQSATNLLCDHDVLYTVSQKSAVGEMMCCTQSATKHPYHMPCHRIGQSALPQLHFSRFAQIVLDFWPGKIQFLTCSSEILIPFQNNLFVSAHFLKSFVQKNFRKVYLGMSTAGLSY